MKRLFATVMVVGVLVASTITGADVAGAAGPTPGMLRVTTSPALPSQISIDGVPRNTWGLDWVKFAPGTYQLCFGAVAGFTAPACQSVTVTSGATTTVVGTFVQRGYLQVSTSPPSPSRISVDGIPRDNWGMYTDIPVGAHQVCFGAVAGLNVPPCQTVTVTAGATMSVTGTFTANGSAPGLAGVGMLRATTTPAVPSQITVDGQIADTWGLNWLELPVGAHQVCFGDVPGFTKPACQGVTITAGATQVVNGAFTQRGYLQVTTSPAVASTISVDGVVRGDWGIFTDLPVGAHQVCFGDVGGYTTPPCQSVTLTAGSTQTVTGTFEIVTVGTWIELERPGGGTWIPEDANRSGLVVGEGYYCTGSCATSGALAMPTGYSAADLTFKTVRDNGAIVAYKPDNGGEVETAIVWTSPGATPAVLKLPANWSHPGVFVVTTTGSVIGVGDNQQGDPYVLLWSDPTVTPTTIPVPGGWSYARAEAYGDSGTVVGWGTGGSTNHGLYVPPPGYQPQILIDPAGFPNGGVAFFTNDSGLIAGYGVNANNSMLPVAWPTPTSTPVVMNIPSGFTFGTLTAVEDNGMIIGTATDGGGNPRVLVWTSPSAPGIALSLPAGTVPDSLAGVLADGTILCIVTGPGNVQSTLVWPTPTSTPYTLSGPAGFTDVLVAGISTDGAVYAGATAPDSQPSLLVWDSLDHDALEVLAPTGYTDVTFQIPNPGAPVIAIGNDGNGDPKGLVFIL